jgi:hypothetical protein
MEPHESTTEHEKRSNTMTEQKLATAPAGPTSSEGPLPLPYAAYPTAADVERHGLQPLPESLPLVDFKRARPHRSGRYSTVSATEMTSEQLLQMAWVIAASFARREPQARHRKGSDAGKEEKIPADLVVDASGRNSGASRWLEELGYEPPEETVVDSHLGYASRLYERAEDGSRDWKALLVQAAPPDITRGGVLYPIEGGRWIAGLSGVGGDYPPTDEEGFMAFARSLRTPMLYETIKDLKPVSPIHGYRATRNSRRHYEKRSRQPDNFLVTGDAACAFNPVYGQGMTTAAIGAETIEEALLERRDMAGLSGRFQRRLAKATAGAWLLATGQDYRVRGVEGPPPSAASRITRPYMARVMALSLKDQEVQRTVLEVYHMLKPPTAMFAPAIAAKVLREALIGSRKSGGSVPAPRETPEAA